MEDRLINILANVLELSADEIDNTASAKTYDGWDSLKQMNIIVAIEEEFGIQFDEEESILSDSYASLLKLLKGKLS